MSDDARSIQIWYSKITARKKTFAVTVNATDQPSHHGEGLTVCTQPGLISAKTATIITWFKISAKTAIIISFKPCRPCPPSPWPPVRCSPLSPLPSPSP